uniref:Ig-like domain-containing protein n=1 Tax=Xenopus tropicalis TaxID=8364 RepID=A0A803JRE5_XENTR
LPGISLSPNWTPIFPGESVTLSCNVAPTAQGNLGYSWYRDEYQIPGDQQRLVIQPARETDSGDYQCQAGASERSAPVRMEVMPDLLILQAPPAVHEGDFLSLRCHSQPGYDTRDTVFYKGNKAIGSPVSGSELQIGRVDVTASGTYRCAKEIDFGNLVYIAKAHHTISVSGKTHQMYCMCHSHIFVCKLDSDEQNFHNFHNFSSKRNVTDLLITYERLKNELEGPEWTET